MAGKGTWIGETCYRGKRDGSTSCSRISRKCRNRKWLESRQKWPCLLRQGDRSRHGDVDALLDTWQSTGGMSVRTTRLAGVFAYHKSASCMVVWVGTCLDWYTRMGWSQFGGVLAPEQHFAKHWRTAQVYVGFSAGCGGARKKSWSLTCADQEACWSSCKSASAVKGIASRRGAGQGATL